MLCDAVRLATIARDSKWEACRKLSVVQRGDAKKRKEREKAVKQIRGSQARNIESHPPRQVWYTAPVAPGQDGLERQRPCRSKPSKRKAELVKQAKQRTSTRE